MIGVVFVSWLLGLSGAMVPGPLFALTLYQARQVGWTAGLWLTVGHMLAELTLICLLYAGLGTALKRPAVTRVISLVGGAVLLYFAWEMGRAAVAPGPLGHGGGGGALTIAGLIGQGVALTLANPYWYLWWATAGVALIAAQSARHGARAWPAFFTGHILADYVWYIAVAILIAAGSRLLSDNVHRGMILACGIGVAALGVGFLVSAARGYLTKTETP